MSATKKRKIDDEGRVFNSELCAKYFVVPHNQGVVCLICQSTIAVIKEYNVKRNYSRKHSSQFDKIVGHARVDKIEHFKNPLKNNKVFLPLTRRTQNC